jgi:hypothetical protein
VKSIGGLRDKDRGSGALQRAEIELGEKDGFSRWGTTTSGG